MLLVLALVVISMVIPSSALEFIRFHYGWVDSVVDFLDTITPGFDMDHLAAFGALGIAVRFGWPRGRFWQVVAGLAVTAGISEFVQMWIPGREAAFTHAMLDIVGGMVGYALAWIVGYAWGPQGLHGHRHSEFRAHSEFEER